MPNKNYVAGRRREYIVMEKLRKIGCDIVFRSAGSHSLIDVIGIRHSDARVFLIQCKPPSMKEKEREALRAAIPLKESYKLTFEVI